MWVFVYIECNGKYYLYFGVNDIQVFEIEDGFIGGIGVGVVDCFEGLYKDVIGKFFIGDFYNGVQFID